MNALPMLEIPTAPEPQQPTPAPIPAGDPRSRARAGGAHSGGPGAPRAVTADQPEPGAPDSAEGPEGPETPSPARGPDDGVRARSPASRSSTALSTVPGRRAGARVLRELRQHAADRESAVEAVEHARVDIGRAATAGVLPR